MAKDNSNNIDDLTERAKVLAEATGRDESDVLADLLDDGILNNSHLKKGVGPLVHKVFKCVREWAVAEVVAQRRERDTRLVRIRDGKLRLLRSEVAHHLPRQMRRTDAVLETIVRCPGKNTK